MSSEEKSEKPTAKKNKESRKEGQVPRTQELGAWSALLLATLAMPWMVGHEITAIQGLLESCLRTIEDPSTDAAFRLLRQGALQSFVALVVLGSLIMVIGVAGAVAQGGVFLATKMVKPDLKKLDPIKGFKRIFGPQSLWEGFKMLVKCSLVGVLVYFSVRTMMPLLGGMLPIGGFLDIVGDRAISLLRDVSLAGLVMAAADYLMQRRRVGKQTRMTKEEVRQEHKQQEGDPMLKGARRSRQLSMSRNRMMAEVAHADVVLVNPTHVAVALRYDAATGAPRVVARGAGAIAARIRELAEEGRVPLVRDVPLARALYTSTDVGQEIPAELFAAVAQVLAFVISRRNLGQRGGQHRSPRREADLGPVPARGRRRRVAPAREGSGPVPVGR